MCVCEIGGGNKVSEVKSTIRSVRVPAPASCSKSGRLSLSFKDVNFGFLAQKKRCKFLPLDKIGALPHAHHHHQADKSTFFFELTRVRQFGSNPKRLSKAFDYSTSSREILVSRCKFLPFDKIRVGTAIF